LSFIAVPLLAGYLTSQPLSGSISATYSQLVKPSFFPPAWVFAPVWTILYVLMGISAYLIWRKGDFKKPLLLFLIQLILNLLWTPIFFYFHQYFWAFVEIVVLMLAIIMTILSFFKRSKPAGLLMLPYLFWVVFASILNYMIFRLN
jgi:tryptophan-rich sensory protein